MGQARRSLGGGGAEQKLGMRHRQTPFFALLTLRAVGLSYTQSQAACRLGHRESSPVRSRAPRKSCAIRRRYPQNLRRGIGGDSDLNGRGLPALRQAISGCFASLFTDRAISYRIDRGFGHLDVALSIAVQKMVHADLAAFGGM